MSIAEQIWPVHADSVPPSAWRNGGGQTRELLTRPGEGDWQLRISLADITRDGGFSAFPGVQRWFAVVQGAGVALRFANVVHTLNCTAPALHFDGAAAPECSLLAGPTRDLNLMLRSGSGSMRQVQAGWAWDEPFAERGVFTRAAGTLQREGQAPVPLAGHTLLWFCGAGACRFEPDSEPAGAEAGPVAWWLGWSPTGLEPR